MREGVMLRVKGERHTEESRLYNKMRERGRERETEM